MRTKTVTRYYCEHCSKGFFQRPAAARHEGACFRNPARVCPYCLNNEEYKPDLEKLMGVPEKDRHAVGGVCPWCLMAEAIKHNTRVKRVANDPDDFGDWVQYPIENFKKDRTDWHNEHGYRIPANEL